MMPSNRDACRSSVFRRKIGAIWRWLLGALCLGLAWHALSRVAWDEVWPLFARLGPLAIATLLGINLLTIPLMTARWWLLLKTLGAPIGLTAACAYRVAVNAVSYFTPGPHFGGEPVSVFLLRHRHGVPLPAATTSVILDRLLELSASMGVMALGLIQLAAIRSSPIAQNTNLPLVVALLTLVMVTLAALFSGRRPLSRFNFLFKAIDGWYARWTARGSEPLTQGIARCESMAESLFRRHPMQFLLANLFSLGHWCAVFAEFWLMAALLGRPLPFWQLTAVVVVTRLSFFTPLPAGIGVLETALPWTTAAMGQGSALGVGLCVIIRLRDILLNLTGLGLGMHYLMGVDKAGFIKKNKTNARG